MSVPDMATESTSSNEQGSELVEKRIDTEVQQNGFVEDDDDPNVYHKVSALYATNWRYADTHLDVLEAIPVLDSHVLFVGRLTNWSVSLRQCAGGDILGDRRR